MLRTEMLLCAICCEVISGIRVEVTTQSTSSISIFTGETNGNHAFYAETKLKANVCVDVSVQPQGESQRIRAEVTGHVPLDTINL